MTFLICMLGAHHNWELQQTHFPGSIPILDYYHAAEHLADFCKLLPATLRTSHRRRWSTMLWQGEVLQMTPVTAFGIATRTVGQRK